MIKSHFFNKFINFYIIIFLLIIFSFLSRAGDDISLPIVFGDEKSFSNFYFNLKNINFPFEEIKTFYLFESKRWDLLTTKNQLIKLPIENYDKSLVNFMTLKDKINFTEYKIFDYRIKDQLILK